MEHLVGQTLRGYELREKIGEGSFGAVYRAYQNAVKREVAMKVILPEYANQPSFIRRFEVEAELVARLEHPHIVPLFDYWRDPNGAYLVLRLVRGGSLRRSLHDHGAWNPLVVARLLDEVAGALAIAHRNGVIHRDIKPDNILLDEEGYSYLTDFGIAKETGTKGEADSEGVVGSPAYMAPEQIKESVISPRTDIYGLGMLIYELLVGRHPFMEGDFFTIIRRNLSETLPDLRDYNAQFPSGLNDVLQKATAKNAETRYETVVDFAKAFRNALQPELATASVELDGQITVMLPTGTKILTISDDFLLGEIKNPYKGLRPFTEADAVDFFGRDALIDQLLRRMAPEKFVRRPRKQSASPLEDIAEAATWMAGDETIRDDGLGGQTLQDDTLPPTLPNAATLRVEHAAEDLLIDDDNDPSTPSIPAALSRFLAVVGPSGSGKSSVVKAGVLPALRRGALPASEDWYITEMVPGKHPILNLENALLSVATTPPQNLTSLLRSREEGLLWAAEQILAGSDTELLLVIDQFEEVFTLVESEEERTHFLDLLRAAVIAPQSPLRIIMTMRADFYDRPLQYVNFGDLIRQRTEVVLPLSAEELERAIRGPAERVGAHVDNELVAAMIGDVSEEPGALPLLQYVLTELFERREGMVMTRKAYHEIGGVLGALARRADEVFTLLLPNQQAVARQVFLRLITLGEGAEDTRRRVRRSELEALGDTQVIDLVLDTYGKYRLLTFDREADTREPTIEVAHEALIREWTRLNVWLDESRSDIRLQRLLAGAAVEWEKARYEVSFLLSGARLAQYEDWARSTDIALTPQEKAYLNASTAERIKQEQAETERQAREIALQRKAANRLRYFAAALSVFLVIAIGLAVFAIGQQQEAENQADLAEQSAEKEREQALIAARALEQSNERGTEVADQVTIAAELLDQSNTRGTQVAEQAQAAATARSDAELAATEADIQRQFAVENAATATIALGQSNERGTEVADQVTIAAELLEQSNERGTEVAEQAQAAATARSDAELAATEADIQRQFAVENAATATIALGQSNARGTEVAEQAQAAATAGRQAELAATEADIQRQNAVANAATATIALGQAESRGTEVADQVTISAQLLDQSNARGTEVAQQAATATIAQGQAEIAATEADVQRQNALANAATATIALGQAEARGTEIAEQRDTVEQALEISEVSERLARAQALSVNADQVLAAGDPDLALALVLEALALNPDLTQAHSVLNRVLDSSPVVIVPDAVAGDISPDEQYMLSVRGDRSAVDVWDIQTRQLRYTLQGHSGAITHAEFSSDGRYVITSSADSSLIVWDTATGSEMHRLSNHAEGVVTFTLHPTNPELIVSSGEAQPRLILWNIEDGVAVREFGAENNDRMDRLFISLDGGTLWTWTDNLIPIMAFWDLNTGRLKYRSTQDYRGFSQDRRTAWTGGKRTATLNGEKNVGAVQFWEAVNETPQRTLPNAILNPQFSNVNFIEFSPNGMLMLLAADRYEDQEGSLKNVGQVVFVINRSNNAVVSQFEGDEISQITSGVFAPDSQTIVSTTPDDRLILWDAVTGRVLQQIGADDRRLSILEYSGNGRYVLTASSDQTIRVWSATGQKSAVLGHLENVHAISPDGQVAVISDEFNRMYFIDVLTGEQIALSDGHGNLVTTGVFTPDGKYLITGDLSGTIIQWDTSTWRLLRRWIAHNGRIRNLMVSDDSRYAFSRSDDGVRRLWDIETGTLITQVGFDNLTPVSGRYSGAFFNPDKTRIYYLFRNELRSQALANAAQDPQEVTLSFDADSTWGDETVLSENLMPRPFLANTDEGLIFVQVRIIAAEPFGFNLDLPNAEINSFTYILEVFNAETGEKLRERVISEALCAAFSPDGQYLLVGTTGNTVLRYDVATGEQARRFVGHETAVTAVTFNPDGLTAMSGSADGTLILWDVNSGESIRVYRSPLSFTIITRSDKEIVTPRGMIESITFSNNGDYVYVDNEGSYLPYVGYPEPVSLYTLWEIDRLVEVIAWAEDNRSVREFTCAERDQYIIRPLCGEETP